MQKRHPFNLVEIILALGIILIGVVSLMGLFPAAAKVTTDAAMETYASNAVEELMAFIADSATRDVESSNTADVGWKKWIAEDTIIPDTEPVSKLDEDFTPSKLEAEILDADKWETIDRNSSGTGGLNKYLFKYTEQPGVFMLVSVRGKDPDDTFSLKDDAELVDSRVLITVWKSKMEKQFKAGATMSEDDGYNYGVRLNVKVGWPAERPEARQVDDVWVPLRQIKAMTFDLHKPVQKKL